MRTETILGPGLADPTRDSQAVFRAVLESFARPGQVANIEADCGAPDGLPASAAALLLTLVDYETPLWLSPSLPDVVRRWLVFHTGAPMTDSPSAAKFAVVDPKSPVPTLAEFHPGEDRYPDKSTTVIFLVSALDGGPSVVLTGPGIQRQTTIAPRGLPADFWIQWSANHDAFPLGVDVVLAAGRSLIALPRSSAARPASGGA